MQWIVVSVSANSPHLEFPWDLSLSVIAEYLLEHTYCKEHDLIQRIASALDFSWANDPLESLFQKHFVARHGLYRLNRLWIEEKKMSIAIGPVDIQLLPCSEANSQTLSAESSTQLEAFYLDKSHFYSTAADEVAELIAGFWRNYQAHSHKSSAFQVLGVEENADWQTVKRRYRSLVMTVHPDRGGDPEKFARISEAYEQLKLLFAK